MKVVSRAAIAASILLSPIATGTAPAAITVGSDPVLFWNQVALANLPGSAPVQTRAYAIVNIAMHDAINRAAGGNNLPYLLGVSAPGGDVRAAASQAAYTTIVQLRGSSNAALDQALADSLALSDPAGRADGILTGNAFANAILGARGADGSTAVVANPVTGRLDEWQPTSGSTPASLQQWGDVTPFQMSNPEQFRPGPPPGLSTAEWATAYNEVKAIGSATNSTRTDDQTASATFWNAANGSQWLQIGLTIAEDEMLTTLQNASAFAILTTALADTQIGGFDAKTHYDFFRPVTAIRAGEADGNPSTIGDPGWTPLNAAPSHQSYISTLSALSGAGSTVLGSIFGSESFSLTIGPNTRSFTGLDAAALDAANSRLWGGIHYGFDSIAGLTMGRQIGQLALGNAAFRAVPEPTTWAMMIAGFGLVGGAMRRRRRRLVFVTA